MIDEDRPAFAGELGSLAAAYGLTLTEDRIRQYWRGLADLPLARVRVGCARVLRSADRFPTVAAIRAALVAAPARGQAADRPALGVSDCPDCDGTGWRVVRRAWVRGGPYTRELEAGAGPGYWREFLGMCPCRAEARAVAGVAALGNEAGR